MGKFVILTTSVKLNSVDLSDRIRSCAVAMSAPPVNVQAMGATGADYVQGLREDSFTMEAYSDFAAAKINATLRPFMDNGSPFLVEVWPAGTVTSATNPKFSGTVIMTEYEPISGAVGDAAMTPLTLPVIGKISEATA